MTALVLRFAGAAQSWGGPSLFVDEIGTEQIPTRSGVLGLFASCLGAPRGNWPSWLDATQISVRVDRAGNPCEDFHTINAVPIHHEEHYLRLRAMSILQKKPAGGSSRVFVRNGKGDIWPAGQTVVTKRRFLANAMFMVAIEHESHFDELTSAVRKPLFVSYLGRKAYPPTFPFFMGISNLGRGELLESIPTFGQDLVRAIRGSQPKTAKLPIAEIVGDRNRAQRTATVAITDREGALAWASENLAR